MNEQYKIRTVQDMLRVPKEKRAQMLMDLELWLIYCDDAAQLESLASSLVGCPTTMNTDTFIWNNDGISGAKSIRFVAGDAVVGTIDLRKAAEEERNG